jgi:hypothetical protein
VATEPGDFNVNEENLDSISSRSSVPLTEQQSTQFITKIEQNISTDETLVEKSVIVPHTNDTDGEGRNLSFISLSSTDPQA